MKTTHVRGSDVAERWLLYDASEHTLGRMATQIAMSLMGKDRPEYTPSEATGAFVVVVNSRQARVSGGGKKEDSHTFAHFTGYAGGLRHVPLADMRERRPNDIVKLAVRRMLPKSKLAYRMLKRLKVYPGPEHPHEAQRPVKVEAR
jgi:large subunit ribosomal protein L13